MFINVYKNGVLQGKVESTRIIKNVKNNTPIKREIEFEIYFSKNVFFKREK